MRVTVTAVPGHPVDWRRADHACPAEHGELEPRHAARGRREGPCGARDVRRHRPALRPRQPGHDVPPRRALAAADGRGPRPPRRQPRARPGQRHRRPVRRPRRRRPAARSRSTFSLGMLRADRSGAPRVQADILRLPMRRRRRRRRHVRLRPAQPRRAAGVLRRARPRRAARADASPCSTSACRATGSCGSATASTSARSCRRSAGGCPTRRPTATCPRSVAYLPPSGRDGRQLRRAGFGDADAPACSRSAWPSCSPAHAALLPDRPDAGRHSARRRRHPALDLNDVARGDGFLFVRDGVGFAGRGVAARVAGRRRAGRARRDRPRRRDRLRRCSLRCRPGRPRLGAVRPGRRRRGRGPRGRRRQGRRRHRAGSPASTTASRHCAPPSAPLADGRLLHDRAGHAVERLPRRRRRGTRRGPRRTARQGGDRPRDRRGRRAARSTATACCTG